MNVYTNIESYQYDIYALVKAFYPECELKISSICESGDEKISPESSDNGFDGFIVKIPDIGMEFASQSASKYEQKLDLYKKLCAITHKTLPWGNLTGIRPTKLPMAMLYEGKTDAQITEWLQSVHAVSDEKCRLSIEIARREKNILERINYKDGYSLYIGIPFCPTTCLYCSFTSYPISMWSRRVDEYLEALFKEIEFVSEQYSDRLPDTVYVGGGTPLTLSVDELTRLMEKIRSCFDFAQVKEFSVEAGRPDSITAEKLEVLKRYGVSRICVNPQTMNDKTLKTIGRQHTSAQTVEAYMLARQEGFDNINMDIILGLPNETKEDMAYTLGRIKELGPDSLTVHSLAVKRASKLGAWIEENGISTLKNTDETMELAAECAREMGMYPYYLYRQKNMSGNLENVGYAKENKYGIYNILIMEEVQTIIACGAGTISKRVYPDGRIERCENVKDVAQYIERIDEMIGRKSVLFSS